MSALKFLSNNIKQRPLIQFISLNSTRNFHPSKQTSAPQKRADNAIVESTKTRNEVDINVRSLGEKVKETTKTASYLGVILLGAGITGTLFYAVFRELFSSQSPNNVYSKAVEKCKDDARVQDKLGTPIIAHGNETRRGRRRQVNHVIFERDGRQCIKMVFYLKGTFHKATVELEMFINDVGSYEYKYLVVQVDDMLQTEIILEDNRRRIINNSSPEILY